ncbi:DUF882 domain-containing protein [uncultured Tateyamaria sp.]|uniref:DUF882 domain-containing protein n=1 Tax=uncultured Tateyamaria sp. TaxID=455651 RepID=UPI00262C971D|nr:DUF882 domain-containing protein [uncultured Tateyamaria sp.]
MLNRRNFITFSACGLANLTSPAIAGRALKLNLYRPRTDERVSVEFTDEGIGHKTYAQVNWILRDVSAGHWKAMDTRLLAIVARMAEELQVEQIVTRHGL